MGANMDIELLKELMEELRDVLGNKQRDLGIAVDGSDAPEDKQ